MTKVHSGGPETNWNFCQTGAFEFVSEEGVAGWADSPGWSVECALPDADAPQDDRLHNSASHKY
jgi:hypothetical protein